MDDDRVRDFETALWIGGEDVYRRSIDPDCLMVVPAAPFLLSGAEAIAAVSKTPRWTTVEFDDLRIGRPQEGLIVIAYGVRAARGEEAYSAYCSSTYRRIEHERWQVVQHQQTVAPTALLTGHGTSGEMERAQQDSAEERESEGGYQ